MNPTGPCIHCGRPTRTTITAPDGHPWRHIETGRTTCTPTTRAEPAT